jgi:hypothetical protein
VGRWWAVGPEEEKQATREEEKKEVGRGSRWAGGGLGRLDRFCFFSFFPFLFSNPFLNQFQTFLNSNLLHVSNSNFNTNFSNYFKGFSQTIFNNFSNIF